MKFLGNIIWLVFGGFAIFLEYLVSSLVLAVTIIGIPFALQTLKLAMLALWPFGSKVVQSEVPSGCFTTIFNIIWIIFFGLWIALTHVFFGVLAFHHHHRHSMGKPAFQTGWYCVGSFWEED